MYSFCMSIFPLLKSTSNFHLQSLCLNLSVFSFLGFSSKWSLAKPLFCIHLFILLLLSCSSLFHFIFILSSDIYSFLVSLNLCNRSALKCLTIPFPFPSSLRLILSSFMHCLFLSFRLCVCSNFPRSFHPFPILSSLKPYLLVLLLPSCNSVSSLSFSLLSRVYPTHSVSTHLYNPFCFSSFSLPSSFFYLFSFPSSLFYLTTLMSCQWFSSSPSLSSSSFYSHTSAYSPLSLFLSLPLCPAPTLLSLSAPLPTFFLLSLPLSPTSFPSPLPKAPPSLSFPTFRQVNNSSSLHSHSCCSASS